MRSARLGPPLRPLGLLAPLLLAAAASCAGAAPPSPTAVPSQEPLAGSPSPSTSPSTSSSSVASASAASARAPIAPAAPSDAARCADASVEAASRLSACEAACATREGPGRWTLRSAEACVAAGELATAAGGGARATLRAAHDFDLACGAAATAPTTAAPGCAKRDALLDLLRAACGVKDLASCVAHGRGIATMHAQTPAARAQANASLTLACGAKSAEACEVRGDLLADQDAPAALASYQQGCDLGRGHARCEQGAMLLLGRGAKADESRAFAARDRARSSGDARCMADEPIGSGRPDAEVRTERTMPRRTVDTESFVPGPVLRVTAHDMYERPDVDASLAKSFPRLNACLDREAAVNGPYAATLRLAGSIDAEGRLAARPIERDAASVSFARCVEQTLRATSFPSGKAIPDLKLEIRIRAGG